MLDIHKYDVKLRNANRLLEESKVSLENKSRIQAFVRFLTANNISKPRIIKYLCYLRFLAVWFGKEFMQVTRDDVERVITHVSQQSYSPWTAQAYKVILKRFFQWLYNCSGTKYPEIVEWISTGIPRNQLPRRTPHEFPTPDDVALLVKTAKIMRDKALVSSLGESGCRIGEIGNLAIRHAHFDEDGAVLYVQGKTGFRPIRIVYASYYLKKWLEAHPLKDNPDAPLWINTKGNTKNQLSHQRLYEILFKTAKKAGLAKKVNPHNFRHGRGTFLAHFLTSYQLCNYMGWTPGSKMPSVYVHMSGQDTDAAILQLHGIKSKTNLQENQLRAHKCTCGKIIPITEKCDCKQNTFENILNK